MVTTPTIHTQFCNQIAYDFAKYSSIVAQHQQLENHASREREEAPTPKGVEPFFELIERRL